MKRQAFLVLGILAHSSALGCSVWSVPPIGDENEQIRLSQIGISQPCPADPARASTTIVRCWTTDVPAYELARRYGFAYGSPPVFGADRWIVPLSGSEYATAVTGKRAIIIPRGRNSFIQLEDQVTDFEIIDDGGYENPAQIDLNRAYRQSQSSGKNEIEPCTEMLRVLGKSLSNCKVYIKFSDEFGLESGITFVFSKTAHPSGLRGKSYRYDGFNECGADMYPVGGNGEILDLSKFWDLPVQTLP